MITQASGLRMGAGRFSRLLRGVGVLAMADAGLDTTRHVQSVREVPLGAGGLRLIVPGLRVGGFIDHHCVADGVEVTHAVISAMRELFNEGKGVEFWPWIEEATELPCWEECHSPAATETGLLAGGSWAFPKGPRFWWFWRLAILRTFLNTGLLSVWGLRKGTVQYRCSTLGI